MNLLSSSLVLQFILRISSSLKWLYVSSCLARVGKAFADWVRGSYCTGWLVPQQMIQPVENCAITVRVARGGLKTLNKLVFNRLARWLRVMTTASFLRCRWDIEFARFLQAPLRWLGFCGLGAAGIYLLFSLALARPDHPKEIAGFYLLLFISLAASLIKQPWTSLRVSCWLWRTGKDWLGDLPDADPEAIKPTASLTPWPPLIVGLLLGTGFYCLGPTVIAVLGGLTGLVLILVYPSLGLYLLAAYAVIDSVLRLNHSLLSPVWDELLFVVLVVVWLTHASRTGQLQVRFGLLGWPVLFFIGISLFRYILPAPHPQVSLEGLRVVIEFILWYYLTVNLLDRPQQVRKLVAWVLLVMTGISLYGFYQYLIKVPIPTDWYESAYEIGLRTRVFSIVGSPNVLGSLLALTFPLSFGLFLTDRRWKWRVVLLIVTAVLGVCLIMTFSRGAWLALAFGLLVFGLVVDRRVLIGLIIFTLLVPIALPTVYQRVAFIASPQYRVSSEKDGRIARWSETVAEWERHPLVGQGFGEVGGAVAARSPIVKGNYTDSYYLKTGAEMGVLGLGALLWLLLAVLRAGAHTVYQLKDPWFRGLAGGIMAGLVAVIFHNMVENVFEVPMMVTYFWFFAGIMVSLPRLEGSTTPASSVPETAWLETGD